jgi:colicin import membrane protein
MKKLVLLCFLFVFSNNFYAQNTKSKKETTKKETTKKKSSYDYDKDVPVKSKSNYDYNKGTNKSEANKIDAKIKDEKYTKGNSKKNPTYKETNEKAPKTPDRVTGTYNGKKVYTGSRGGKYYINKNGNKTYIQD